MVFLIDKSYRIYYFKSRPKLSDKEKSEIKLLLDLTDESLIESGIKSITQQALDVLLYLAWYECNLKIIRILFPYSTRISCPLGLSLLLNLVFNRYQQEYAVEAVECEIKQSYMLPYHDILLLLSVKAKNQKVLTILLKLMEKTLIESTIQSMTDEYIDMLLQLTSNSENDDFQEIQEMLSKQKIGE